MAGFASKCVADADCPAVGMTCNNLPDPDVASVNVPTATPACRTLMINREGGPRCDVAPVGFGEYCAPAVARCETHVAGSKETGHHPDQGRGRRFGRVIPTGPSPRRTLDDRHEVSGHRTRPS